MAKEVVVILPYVENKVLMQLRDDIQGIDFPGHWGFFGGAINICERPDAAAWRELFEEIGYIPSDMPKLSVNCISDLDDLVSHAYYCALKLPLEAINLQEGMDYGLFELDEVSTQKLFSRRMGGFFPVIPNRYVIDTIQQLHRCLGLANL